jgi:hypothetical protein
MTVPPGDISSVDGDCLVEQVGSDIDERRRNRRDAGVVHQHVNSSERRNRFVYERRALIPLADVALGRQRSATLRADLVGHLLARVALAAGDGHVGARVREPERHGTTKAPAASGDDHDLA